LSNKLNVAIYPGSFDPLTNGHLDLISRSSILFDKVIVAVSKKSINKNYLFNENERLNLIKKNIQHLDNVSAQVFEGLLINYAKSINANIIIRGLRALSDFESEFQMSLMNRKLNDNINTVFLMPHEKYTYISSSIVKEVFSLKGNVDEYVPKSVLEAMKNKHE
jgi:pantetheine-phosphate adenylyltransferase|tara:strand:- start:1933 stop:2424 length:492 start_codon:yes stop_codon:yes gene_type:complete